MRDLVNWFGFKAHADNIPLHLPGVYLIVNLSTDKKYVGTENRIQTSKQVSKSLSSPEAKHIHSLASTRNRARPEVKAKYTALRGKRITITDGVHEKAHFRDCEIPQGWYRGRSDIFKSYWKQSQKEPTGSSITITSTES